MSAYTPRRSASRAWVRTLRASAMFTPSRRAASTSAAARSRIVSARAYLRWASAFSIAFDASGRMRWYSLRASAFRASARWLSASSTFPPRSSAYRTRAWAFSTIPWRTRSRRWSSVRMEIRRSKRSAATKSPRPARARAWSMFRWNASVSMPAFLAPSSTASAYASASATRALRRAISRARREARARSSARPRSPAASVCSARSNRLRANDGSATSRLEGTRSLRAAAIARFVMSGAARVVRPRSNGCPQTSHAERPSGTSDSQRGQRAMWLQPRGRPPHREGMTPLDVGCAGINEASSISHLITVWLGPVATRFPKSFSSRAPIARPSGPSRAGRTRRCLGLAGRRGRSLVGMAVVDGEGVEVGYVSGEEANTLVLGEGSGGRMRLGRRFVSGVVDRVTLRGPAAERSHDESDPDHRKRLEALCLLKVGEPGSGWPTNPVLVALRTYRALLGRPAEGDQFRWDAVGEEAAAGYENVRARLRDARRR